MSAGTARFLLGMDAATREFLRRVNEYVGEKVEARIDHDPYFETRRDGEAKSKVVKVSTVIQIPHYMAATMAFRTLPKAWLTRLEEFAIRPGVRFIAKRAALAALETVPSPRTVLAVVKGVGVTIEEAVFERQLEKSIREAVDTPRNQVQALTLSQGSGHRRGVRDVLSRHKTPPKKRMKKWYSQ